MHEHFATLTEEYNPVVGAEVPYLNIEPEGLKIVARIERELEEVPSEALLPCLLYTSPSPRDRTRSRMPSSA